ncbi:hybrid sensor histidine kinase/response regulator [Duganella sp. FT27W]|uniref:hybrid sensor histidine kinase/response regulator n=1 Tax=Duganella sp. FT27W TaxID=2654636 RepID=UPI00128B0293|nr:hybrid sensor histidine kinase/response regulator [Duganella sp. FT27W]MPQ59731.1 response regulator [Duganella sp. FT27W]
MTSSLSFLDNGGAVGALMRAHDWTATALGDPHTWPQSLRSSLSACLNSPILGAVLWGPDLCMFYNDAYAESLADRHPAALAQPVASVWGSAWDKVAPDFQRAMATGLGFSHNYVELMIYRHGRREKTFWNFVAAPIVGEDGSVVGLLNQGQEITEQVRKDREIHTAQATLVRTVDERTRDRNRLWELSADIMLRCGFDGRINTVNPAWHDVLGLDESELVGANLLDHIHPDDINRTADAARILAEGGSVTRFDNRYRHQDGSYRWISWSIRPDAENIYAVGRDVTAEKEQAELLRSAEDALRQAQKMEAVGQLTGGLAHDFNNLLAGIQGSLDMISQRIGQGRYGDIKRYVDVGSDAAKRAASLTHRLLAFSRQQTLDPKPTDVNRLVRGMEDLVRRTVGPAVQVEAHGPDDLWTALVDPSQLENSLLNLCINARDAMPEGGHIRIATANHWLDGEAAEADDLPAGEYLSLSVQDTGTGIAPEVIARVFEPFFTTKQVGEGTGLGLSMVYGFAKQSGGHVRIYSEPGVGTTVCIYLPRHDGVADAGDTGQKTSTVARDVRSATVLVVDDEPSVRLLIADILADLGCTVLQAGDSAAGLAVLESGAPIDLLVSDIGLPGGMNGRQMAERGMRIKPRLRVLFLTGYAEAAVLGNGKLAEGMAVMTKPFDIDVLSERVAEMLAGA